MKRKRSSIAAYSLRCEIVLLKERGCLVFKIIKNEFVEPKLRLMPKGVENLRIAETDTPNVYEIRYTYCTQDYRIRIEVQGALLLLDSDNEWGTWIDPYGWVTDKIIMPVQVDGNPAYLCVYLHSEHAAIISLSNEY